MNTTLTQQLLDNSLINKAFETEEYRGLKAEFLENCIKGSLCNPTLVIADLLNQAVDMCGISKGRRTVFYDLAWCILVNHPTIWSESDKADEFPDFMEYVKLHHPTQAEVLDCYDVAVLQSEDYFKIGMELLSNQAMESRAGFCYALHLMLIDMR